jgi:hypothetical protein
MNFPTTIKPLQFICFDNINHQLIMDRETLDAISIRELRDRYLALQMVGEDKHKSPLYLYDMVKDEEDNYYFIDYDNSILLLRSIDSPNQTLVYYSAFAEKHIKREGSILLLDAGHLTLKKQ